MHFEIECSREPEWHKLLLRNPRSGKDLDRIQGLRPHRSKSRRSTGRRGSNDVGAAEFSYHAEIALQVLPVCETKSYAIRFDDDQSRPVGVRVHE